jgi:hypothetical protein
MKTHVLIPLAVVAGLLGPAAHASETQDRIIAELQDQGYSRIEVSRTLLGRTRIVAEGDDYVREIVLNPASGVILRDFLKRHQGGEDDGGSGASVTAGSRDGASGGTSDDRSGSSSGSDRDDSDDRDDDDNSGSGSSGSGSGSDDDSDDDDSDDDSDNSGSGSDDSDDSSDSGDDGDSDDNDDDDD